jgi:hypothetical protein
VTGREVLKEIAGDEAVESLYARGFVCVPRIPSWYMLNEAYDAAPGEDLRHIWDELISASESTQQVMENPDQRG